jgi:hypothetical protein
MRILAVQYQPRGLRSKSSVHGSSTVNEPVLSSVATIGVATIVASSASSILLDAAKVTVPEAGSPELFKYLPTTFLVFTSDEKLIGGAPESYDFSKASVLATKALAIYILREFYYS